MFSPTFGSQVVPSDRSGLAPWRVVLGWPVMSGRPWSDNLPWDDKVVPMQSWVGQFGHGHMLEVEMTTGPVATSPIIKRPRMSRISRVDPRPPGAIQAASYHNASLPNLWAC